MSRAACEICGDTYDYCGECGTCHKCVNELLEQQLATAHREGWEQAKSEMAQEVDMEGGIKYKPGSWEQQALYKAANRIRAMEYKGAEKTV